ncbi:hypothetical protein CRG98_009793 [Punica granatum]|uniref:Uncharacterized protein n=1 Tax=Punica granatum TaxID=22663 RepID=A0A2I0KN73_PUNGR|nr:hypothetical protein CRG98_009793 [Punica granatum]
MGALESETSGSASTHGHHQQQQQADQTVENAEAVQFPPQNPQAFPIPSEHQPTNDHHHHHRHDQMQYHLRHDNHPFPTDTYPTPSSNPIPATCMAPPPRQPVHYTGQPRNDIPASNNYMSSHHHHHHHHQHHQVLTAPPMLQGNHQVPTVPWTTGLFDCMDDPMNALIACCIPCLTFGQIAEIIDSGNTSCATSGLIYGAIMCLIGCPCILSCTYRTKLRSRFSLVESVGPDWISHFLCECCALSQEYRELKNRGLDPSIGKPATFLIMIARITCQTGI